MDLLVSAILIVVLIGLSAFFSSAEIAFVSITPTRVDYLLSETKSFSSKLLKRLKDSSDSTIITILIGNNLVNIAAATIATDFSINLFGDLGLAISTGAMTLLILTFGEIIPKTLASRYSEEYLLIISIPLYYLSILFSPLIFIFKLLSNGLSRFIKVNKRPSITEEELEALVDKGVSEGEIDELKKEIISNVFDLSETTAREIMVPRVDVFALPENKTVKDFLNYSKQLSKTHTRIPIYKDSLDNITGVVFLKDIYKALVDGKKDIKLRDIARKPYFVPATKKIDSLLEEMRENNQHLVFLVDEHGGLEGIVTFEDVLEELVGEIYDEDDKRKRGIIKIGNSYYLDGETELADIEELLGISFDDFDADRISGVIAELADRIPKPGDVFIYKNLKIEIIDADEKRIKRIKITVGDNNA